MSAWDDLAAPQRVLIVEDDRDSRRLLAELLERRGYVVETAVDGAQALERLAGGPRPNLILLDLHMPMLDGYQLRELLRADPELAAIPTIVMTAVPTIDRKRLGAVGVLPKPVREHRLLTLLAHHARAVA